MLYCVGQDFFRVNPLGYGATYQAHPVALACGYEVVKYTIAEDIVGKAHALEPVLKEEMQRCECRACSPRLHALLCQTSREELRRATARLTSWHQLACSA